MLPITHNRMAAIADPSFHLKMKRTSSLSHTLWNSCLGEKHTFSHWPKKTLGLLWKLQATYSADK